MSQDHKTALALGRKESRAIRAYLDALASKKPGRPATKETLEKRLTDVVTKIDQSDNPLESLELVQKRIDLEAALSQVQSSEDFDDLEAGFVAHAKSYSERKGISYTAWREIGVPAATVRAAGIAETRRR